MTQVLKSLVLEGGVNFKLKNYEYEENYEKSFYSLFNFFNGFIFQAKNLSSQTVEPGPFETAEKICFRPCPNGNGEQLYCGWGGGRCKPEMQDPTDCDPQGGPQQ